LPPLVINPRYLYWHFCHCQWLRFYDRQENLVLLPEEIAEQERQLAEQEQQRAEPAEVRAERLAARLRIGEKIWILEQGVRLKAEINP